MIKSAIAFSLVGGLITALSALGYLILVGPLSLDPYLSLTLVFIIFSFVGYVLHSQISFREITGGRMERRGLSRYFVTNLAGFFLNQTLIFFLVTVYRLPQWSPVVPMILVTPMFIFIINRYWVFRYG